MNRREIIRFQKVVHTHYSEQGRNLPWRHTKNPYHILVSEIMLQQTQVDRVIPKYKAFLKKFPTIRMLRDASLADVLILWQGLGYNRRGKFLYEVAKQVVFDHGGRFPKTVEHIEALPGVGPYTARAVMAFAYNSPEVFIETNIRTVYLHHFFKERVDVSDREILPYIEKTLDTKNSRMWYWALMDYGAWLKREHGNANRKSAHYIKQSKFQGSNRQIRGLIIKTVLAEKEITAAALGKRLEKPVATITTIASALVAEGLLIKTGGKYTC